MYSHGDYSTHQGDRSAYMQGSTIGKKRQQVPSAGILNAKTLAEENLKGFRLKNL